MHKDDLQKITRQLGREPRDVVGVAKRCTASHPQVITTYPIRWVGGAPQVFPTLYWLTCPALWHHVSELEAKGWVSKLQDLMATDDSIADAWNRSHHIYATERVGLVPARELALLRDKYPRQAAVLEESGVGGARGPGIKCLHTNLAHYLIDGANPIGHEVARLLIAQGVDLEFCHCDELEAVCQGEGES